MLNMHIGVVYWLKVKEHRAPLKRKQRFQKAIRVTVLFLSFFKEGTGEGKTYLIKGQHFLMF